MQVLVGCDPEVFVKQSNVFVSAHGLIPGNKATPHKVPNGAVQVDGMALEFNIDAAADENTFVGNIESVLATLKSMCPNHEIVTTPVADFTLEYIRSQPAEARELGCEPDFNAYTGMANLKPNAELPMRTASGHVHIGWGNNFDVHSEEHDSHVRAVVKQMDVFLGIPSLFYDQDTRRRSMYGNGGCYRRKPYGCEYRTLSNAWLLSTDRMRWVYQQVQAGIQALVDGNCLYDHIPDIQDIINKSDRKRAEQIVKQFDLKVCA